MVFQTLAGHSSDVNSCHFHEDLLATGSADATVRLWKENQVTEMFEETHVSPITGHSYSIYCVQFTSTGSLVTASLDGSLIVWDVSSGEQLQSYHHPDRMGFRVVRASSGGTVIAAGGDDNCCHLWNIETDMVDVLVGHENTVMAVALSETLLVTGCSGGTLRLWDMNSQSCLKIVDDVHDLGVTTCALKSMNNETEIVTAGNDAKIKIFNWNDKEKMLELKVMLEGHSGPIMSLEFSASGESLASTSGDKTVKIWETESYRCLATLGPHPRYVTSGVFAPSKNIFAASYNRFVNLWRFNSDQKFGIENVAVVQWSRRQVIMFLQSEGLEKYVDKFPNVDGKELVQFSLEDLRNFGLTEADASKCFERVQQIKYSGIDSGDFVEEIPHEFICPITYDLMVNPVKCGDGFVYEKSAISEWLMTRRNTSPMTNLQISDTNLVPCLELRLKIEEFRKSS